MELREYLGTLGRRWPTIVVLTLLGTVVAAAATFLATPKYESTSQLFVSTSQADAAQALQGELFSQQRAQSYARLLAGEEMARRVVNELDLQISPIELTDDVRAEVVLETVLLSVTVTNEDPELAQAIAQSLSEEFVGYVAELETPEGLDTAPIKATVVDPASVPGDPVSPRPVLNIAVGVVLGLVLGLVVAVLRELFDTTVKSPEDLQQAVPTPMLGTIHYDKDAPTTPLITSLGTHHPRVEAMRIIRTNLQYVDVDSDAQSFIVTSSVPGEGKSTTAANIALAAAQSGRQVVLVEADLRRPRIAEYLGLEASVGVTSVLIGRVDLDGAIQEYEQAPGLDVLTSGALPPNPSELLQTNAMQELLEKLSSRYDLVVIDAPPLLPVTDAAVLATMTDGVIFVVKHGSTNRDQVRTAAERVTAVGATLLGAVVNMTPTRGTDRYSYYGAYGYGSDFVNTTDVVKESGPLRRRGRGSRRA